MPDPIHLEAPWDRGHAVITAVVTSVCLTCAFLTGWATVEAPDEVHRALALGACAVCVGIPLSAWLFAPVGFTVAPGRVTVHRRLGKVTYERAGEARAVDPYLVAGAYRVFGSGGVFGRYGRFRHSVLGSFRLYARRRAGTVAFIADHGTVVIAPSDPEAVIRTLGELRTAA